MSLYLTQAIVPFEIAARRQKDGGFSDSYAWHLRSWDCFPNQPDAKKNFLTRVDATSDGFRLLLLSETLPTKPNWCPDSLWHTKSIHETFLSHPRYRFSLLANPTKKPAIHRNNGGTGRGSNRVALKTREDLLAWIERKGLQHGFSVQASEITTNSKPAQHFQNHKTRGLHIPVEFTGILTVTDPALFTSAFRKGIGSSKAFGFGMLCISPI